MLELEEICLGWVGWGLLGGCKGVEERERGGVEGSRPSRELKATVLVVPTMLHSLSEANSPLEVSSLELCVERTTQLIFLSLLFLSGPTSVPDLGGPKPVMFYPSVGAVGSTGTLLNNVDTCCIPHYHYHFAWCFS